MDLQIEGVVDVDELQSGRSSIIYRAHHRDLGREIAIKVFRSLDQEFLTRFETDIKDLIPLSADRRIATVYGSGLTGAGQAYLILELCESSFADVVAEDGPMAPLRACDVLIDVARAISTAHAEGVVHGNLRPDKILVDANQELNVADFGLWFGSLSVGTGINDPFIAPEANPSGTMAPSADIYSFGALLGHTIDGNPPPSDEDGAETEPMPDLVLDGVPDAIREVIETCLSPDPAARPSADEVVARIESAVDSERLFDGEAVFDLSWLESAPTLDDEQAAEPTPEELPESEELSAATESKSVDDEPEPVDAVEPTPPQNPGDAKAAELADESVEETDDPVDEIAEDVSDDLEDAQEDAVEDSNDDPDEDSEDDSDEVSEDEPATAEDTGEADDSSEDEDTADDAAIVEVTAEDQDEDEDQDQDDSDDEPDGDDSVADIEADFLGELGDAPVSENGSHATDDKDPEPDADPALAEDSPEEPSVDEPRLAEDEDDPFFGRGGSTATEDEQPAAEDEPERERVNAAGMEPLEELAPQAELPPLAELKPIDFFAPAEADVEESVEEVAEEPVVEPMTLSELEATVLEEAASEVESEPELEEESLPNPELEIVIEAVAKPPADVRALMEAPSQESNQNGFEVPITAAGLDIVEEAPAAKTNGTHTNGFGSQSRGATGPWSNGASQQKQVPAAQPPAQSAADANLFGARSELRTVGAPVPSTTTPEFFSTGSSSRLIILFAIAISALVMLFVAILAIGNRSGSEEGVIQLSAEGPPVPAVDATAGNSLEVEIPLLRGKTESDAVSSLAIDGFKVEVVFEDAPGMPAGRVIGQEPQAGTTVAYGSEVTLTLSRNLEANGFGSDAEPETSTGDEAVVPLASQPTPPPPRAPAPAPPDTEAPAPEPQPDPDPVTPPTTEQTSPVDPPTTEPEAPVLPPSTDAPEPTTDTTEPITEVTPPPTEADGSDVTPTVP